MFFSEGVQNGTSKAGKDWQKLTFTVETTEEYNNLYAFEIFGEERVEKFTKFNKIGAEVDVDFNVSTNEWKGKYFTTLQAWKIFKAEQTAPATAKQNDPEDDDLPF